MKLKEYISHLQTLEKNFGDVELIYGTDDEGNSYKSVYYAPSAKRVFKKDLDEGSIDCMNISDYNYKKPDEEGDTTVVCIN